MPTSRVLLIDLDLQFGQVATHLNLMPRYDIGGLATDEQALADPELARAYLTSHSSGLVVLAAPVRPEADFRVTLDHLQRIIELFRPWFDHIIVDLGSRLDPRALWLLEQADAHVFVLFPEIAALRAMSLLMAFLAETTPLKSRAVIVVNHVFPKELLKSRDVENLLRTKPAAEIPYTGRRDDPCGERGRAARHEPSGVAGGPGAASGGAGGHRHRATRGGSRRRVASARACSDDAPDLGTGRGARCGWCRRRDSNPHALRPPGLSRLRLPFRHSGAPTGYPKNLRDTADDGFVMTLASCRTEEG